MNPGFSTESYSAFAHIGLRENPGKKSQPDNLPRPGIEPGPPVSRADALTVTPQVYVAVRTFAGSLTTRVLSLTRDPREIFDFPPITHIREAFPEPPPVEAPPRGYRFPREINAYGRIQKCVSWEARGKKTFGRPRRRWEDNIKMDLREVGYDGRDWINLAQVDDDQHEAAGVVRRGQVPHCASHLPAGVHSRSPVSRPSRTRRSGHHVAPRCRQIPRQQLLMGLRGPFLTVGHSVVAASVASSLRSSHTLRV
ncbi:hypothetical protein ANN_06022 [Periplaneta americana]|uniref:Uncharacterized protein n=1 Tax=Periplaneta americana TaxID=6978 RepID=A0ABQ8TDN9_PERAM|nr:hypothetical protein ANN_06022 [Periplaneta americana]